MELVTLVCRAAMFGLAWAAAWVPIGIVGARLTVGELDPERIGGPLYAGFICGVVFSGLAGIASSKRRLDELSIYESVALGALSGLFVGVLPFVLGEGDGSDYEAGWATTIVATSAVVAGLAASRRWSGSFARAATLAAAVSGLVAGQLMWFSTTATGIGRFLPVAMAASLSLLSVLSACVSVLVARWERQSQVA